MAPATGVRLRHVVGEVATGVTVGVGQRHPQLDTVQNGGGRGGDLGMADARARGHQVQLAGPHHRVYARAVAMLHLTAEQPTDSLQSGVGMRRHVHPLAATHVVGAVVVGETPGPDQRPLALRQRASHQDRPRPAQRYLARMQHTGEWRSHTGDFGGRGVGVAHGITVASLACGARHRGANDLKVVVVDLEHAETELVAPPGLVLDEVKLRRSAAGSAFRRSPGNRRCAATAKSQATSRPGTAHRRRPAR